MKSIVACLACFLLVSFAFAQVTVGGRVLDAQSNPLSGATVTLMSMGMSGGGMGGGGMGGGMGSSVTTTSSTDGSFSFANVTAGTYSLKASLTGYSMSRCVTFTITTTQTEPVSRNLTLNARTTGGMTRRCRID